MPRNNNKTNDNELRGSIQAALQSFESKALRKAAISLLNILGYNSDKTIKIPDSDPQAFLKLLEEHNPDIKINKEKALFDDWLKADVLFQLTDEELSHRTRLFKDDAVNTNLLQSYLFFAIELKRRDYARGRLTAIARQLNRVFPMPVMVFIKHRDLLSIAVINRRLNKRDTDKDVLGKVTIIRHISLAKPHRGHLDILESFALPRLLKQTAVNSFDTLHAAWEKIFNVELLNERFYKELFKWYFWALPKVRFPDDMKPQGLTEGQEAAYYEKLRATGLIRLLTRLIFCWFLKEKGLIPESLFDKQALNGVLKNLDDDKPTYYQAILQNLFFATLNQRMGKDNKGALYRRFAKDEGFLKNRDTYGVDNLYRYESLFKNPDMALKEFEDIPFLNGGLFECLDRADDNGKKIYVDGFSRNHKKRSNIPNRFFFGEGEVNIGTVTGEKRRGTEKASGLIQILSNYKFTIDENTPIDQEIALDPELLGKVFENLLASYNEETKTTARKQTGSFYTPRPIVDYMVDESLKAHLSTVLGREHAMAEEDARTGLDILFSYTEQQHPFEEDEVDTLIRAIDNCKILDPACGSGAFPMGVLHKLVYILAKLDPDNARWKQTQLDKLDSVSMRDELERTFENNNDDYGRKLYLIENCLYGVDIQPIAIQLSKLRFFISLICDQKTNKNKAQNHGVSPLPNLETKFVAANTLIRFGENIQMELFKSREIETIEAELQKVRHKHFAVQNRQQKLALQREDRKWREKLAEELIQASVADHDTSLKLAKWNPYDPHIAADFFEPLWMFDRSIMDGFDLVIGNPPYVQLQRDGGALAARYQGAGFSTFARTGDIYCLFYERGWQILKPNAHLCFITSNKWMRAEYGKAIRRFFTDKTRTVLLIDFAGQKIFESATVDINILLFQRRADDSDKRGGEIRAVTANEQCRENLSLFVQQNAVAPEFGREDSWIILSPIEQSIKRKIEAVGTPLKDWDISINYGIKTGCNDAFIIHESKRTEILAGCETEEEHKRTDELIRPILRGRDIKKYEYSFEDIYLINSHNGYVGSDGNWVPRININDFPTVKQHLNFFEPKLSSRADQGDTPYNLRSCAYMNDFSKPKIVWGEISDKAKFALDEEGKFIPEATTFLMTGDSLYYLFIFLNSTLSEFQFSQIATTTGVGTVRWKKFTIEKLRVPKILKTDLKKFIIIAEELLCVPDKSSHKKNLNQMIYEIFNLTTEEKTYIDQQYMSIISHDYQ